MLTAGVLRRMAANLELDIPPDDMAGRGQSQAARDAFWAAVERALAEASKSRRWRRIARLYEAQAEVLRAEGRPYLDEFTRSFEADLEGVAAEGSTAVSIIANDCAACSRDDRTVVTVQEERKRPRLPHLDCQNQRCTCMYVRGSIYE